MKKFFKIFLILFFVAMVVASLSFLIKKSKKPKETFQTQQAFYTNIVNKTVATGSVVPRKEIDIKPQVSGIIDKIYVEAGDTVKKGDMIARVKIIPDMISLNNAESRLKRAKIALENSKKEFERQKQLYDKNIVSESDYLRYELDYKQAREEVDASENNLQLIKEGISKKSKTASNTIIRSTINGMVLDVPVEEGNSVIEANTFNAGTSIATVANMHDIIFEGKVDESEVGKIKIGMPLILRIGAIENQTFDASLEYIAPKGVEVNGAIQFEIKAKVKLKQDQFIRAGYSATADIVLDKRDNVLAANEALLQFDPKTGESFVEVQTAEGGFEKRELKTGLSDGINIEIISGIDTSDHIKVWNQSFGMPAEQ